MTEAVSLVFGRIPIVDSEGGGPTEVVDLLAACFDPLSVTFELEADLAGFVWIEGVKLGGEFKKALMGRVDTEGYGLVAWDAEVDNGRFFLIPPIIRCEGVFSFFEGGDDWRGAMFVGQEKGGEGDGGEERFFHGMQ